MKHRYKGSYKETERPAFANILCEDVSDRLSAGWQAQRKTEQLCRQVQRALNLALADRTFADGVSGVFVDDVLPAPDCGRMLVSILVPHGQSIADTIGALRRDAPRLRAEVANAISRKRAPELFFAPAFVEDGDND